MTNMENSNSGFGQDGVGTEEENRSKLLAQQVKDNPEKAIEKLKRLNMQLSMQKESIEKEIELIRSKAKEEDNVEMIELIERIENASTDEEMANIEREIIEEEKNLIGEMEELFRTDSAVIREIYNEYGI